MSATRDIKDFALDIGYSQVGITSADSFQDHIDAVRSRGEVYDFFVADPRQLLKGAEPMAIMDSARSIISLAWDYAQKDFPETLLGKVGRVYQARCYNAPPDRINGARYQLMLDFLAKMGCEVGKGIFIPERRAGARAGVTTFGRNNFAYTGKSGSFILLSSIVIDKELEYDAPTYKVKCPKDCTACMDACPTKAIYEPLKLNPRRCLAFNAFWTQDGRPLVTSNIPPEIREKMGTRVHGCDVCQEACPRNAAKLKAKYPEDPFLVQLAKEFSLPKMLEMTDEFYQRTIHPIMYNYITDKKYLRRNAAIALGNTGDRQHIPVLAKAMEDSEELVRGYSAWALGRIGGPEARRILESSLKRENCGSVMDEIKAALADSSGSL
ncbi:MAG: HEAT repeat domain-containing protein [Syntrophobacteraceae bacterium]|nr:HEAT repeat domain-containing protein [Syntrophobacteraceae bacterium]